MSRYRVDFMRHGEWDKLIFDTRADAAHFEWWGLESGVFIRATIHEDHHPACAIELGFNGCTCAAFVGGDA